MLDWPGALLILVLSLLWLDVAGGFFTAYIAKNPFPEKWVFISVGIGVLYTAIGGIGINYSILVITLSIFNVNLPMSAIWLILISPWIAFLRTGPIMGVGQYVKHSVIDVILLRKESS